MYEIHCADGRVFRDFKDSTEAAEFIQEAEGLPACVIVNSDGDED